MTGLVAFFIGGGGASAGCPICEQPPWRGSRAWLPDVLLRHPGVLESAWCNRHTCAALSSAQGMGVRRHLLRPDRRGRILRGSGRLRSLRFSRDCPADHHWFLCGIVGSAAAEPYHRRPLCRRKRPGRYKHENSGHCLKTRMIRLTMCVALPTLGRQGEWWGHRPSQTEEVFRATAARIKALRAFSFTLSPS